IVAPMTHLPYFLPDDWPDGSTPPAREPTARERPYVAAAGRLVKMKGFQQLISVMKYLPQVDLRLAGTGPYESTLRAQAEGLSNVRFEGLLSGPDLSRLFHGARAVVVPSLFPETFGYVVLESFAAGTPVVVHEGGGAIHETGVLSGGGLGYRTEAELLVAIRRIVHDDRLRDSLAEAGMAKRRGEWSESAHLARYLDLIHEIQERGRARTPHGPAPKGESTTDRRSVRSRAG
ncbi:MAG: glycosyltransferase, partial [Isosphaeraceae bacterium]